MNKHKNGKHAALAFALILFLSLTSCYYDIDLVDPPGSERDETPPEAISLQHLSLKPDEIDVGTLHLSFQAPSDLKGGESVTVNRYQIGYSTDSFSQDDPAAFEENTTKLDDTGAPGEPGELETFEITGLDEDSMYYIGLRSFDGAGNASPLIVVNAKTKDGTAPPAPTEFSVTNPKNGISLSLSWSYPVGDSDAADLLRFILVRKIASDPADANDGTRVIVNSDGSAGYDYSDDDASLVLGDEYHYAIYAEDDDGLLSASPIPKSARFYQCLDENDCDGADKGCGDDFLCRMKPVITDIGPSPAEVGETVTISGSDFGDETEPVAVFFDTVAAIVESVSDLSIDVTVPPLEFPVNEQIEFDVTVAVYGVSSPSYALPVRPQWPTIESITPDSADVGDSITFSGRHFILDGSDEATIRFQGASDSEDCEQTSIPDSGSLMNTTVPACAVSGEVKAIVGAVENPMPQPKLLVKKSMEADLNLSTDRPINAAMSLDGKLLAVLTPQGLRLWGVELGTLSELGCGNEAPNVCYAFTNPTLAGFLSLDGILSVFVYAGGDPYLTRLDFDESVDYSTNAPQVSGISCVGSECSAAMPTQILPDPSGERILLVINGRLWELIAADDTLSSITAVSPTIISFLPGPHWRYGYAVSATSRNDYAVNIIDIIPYSLEKGQTASTLGTGSVQLALAADQGGRRLWMSDPNEADPKIIRRWDVSDPRNPESEDNITGVPALKRMAFSYDGQSVYAVGDDLDLYRYNADTGTGQALSAPLGEIANEFSIHPDGGRIIVKSLNGIQFVSLDWAAPLVASMNPSLLETGEEITLTLANDACDGMAAMLLNLPGAAPVALSQTGLSRAFSANVGSLAVSGSATISCAPRPDSPSFQVLIGSEHQYTNFQVSAEITGLHRIGQSDDSWLLLRSNSPDDIGLVELSDDAMIDHDALGLSDETTEELTGSVTSGGDLYAVSPGLGLIEADTSNLPTSWSFENHISFNLSNPRGISVSEDGSTAFVCDRINNQLHRVDLTNMQSLAPFSLGGCSRPLDVFIKTETIYVACESSQSLAAFAVADGSEVGNEVLGFDADSLSVGPGTLKLLVSGGDRTAIVSINDTAGTFGDIEQVFIVGEKPVAKYENDRIWIGTDQGLFLFQAWSGNYRFVKRFDAQVKAIEVDPDGGLFLGMPDSTVLNVYQ